MDNTAIILIISTNVTLVIVLGGLGFFIYKLLKQQNQNQFQNRDSGPTQSHTPSAPNYHPEILERMKTVEKIKPRRMDLFCPNHPEEPGEASCAVCDKLFCKQCIRPFRAMHLCKEHLPLIMKHDWDEVLTIKTSTEDPEQGVKLYDVKKKMFQDENIPTYVETHYKINVDDDFVETYLVLFGLKPDVPKLREKLSQLQITDNT